MTKYGLLYRVTLGVRQKPLRALVGIFIAYATIWAILEPLIGMLPEVGGYFSGDLKFSTLLFASTLIGLYRSAVPKDLIIQYGNSIIKIAFGDLFAINGLKVIPVSRYFFEVDVVPTSLQHKVIQLFVRSEEGSKGFDAYEKNLSLVLKNEPHQEVYRSALQRKDKYYPLGTSVPLDLNGETYILFALTETELKGCIPNDNCNTLKMWNALDLLWQNARIHSRGNSINVPLIGSGVTGIRLSASQILELNLLAIANAIEESGNITTEEIRIILHPKYMEAIDLRNFQRLWKA
ncbi:MAG: hypothetical protein KME14_01845 [Tildeniella torsiva UHER 1998/13D]|jgi:hypothetical protein|nr:hypothetical protein [Tildeniella torsiva UHER 1998/13D]